MTDADARNRLGRWVETPVADETVRAFAPPALPPDPPIDILGLLRALTAAERGKSNERHASGHERKAQTGTDLAA
jgi:hypothetical protein